MEGTREEASMSGPQAAAGGRAGLLPRGREIHGAGAEAAKERALLGRSRLLLLR